MLKEQDALIELIRDWIIHPEEHSAGCTLSAKEVFELIEQMIFEHVSNPNATNTRICKYLPKPPRFFLPLDLVDALKEYDRKCHLLHRRYVPPTFKEIRHILNLATVCLHCSDELVSKYM